MTAITKIEWADSTFNPWQGCTKISPACDHCYAEAQVSTRLKRVEWGAGKARVRTSPGYWRHPLRWNAERFVECPACRWRGSAADFKTAASPQACPGCGGADWAEARRRVFCASLADVFDNEVLPSWRADLFDLIRTTPNLDWLLLTKRVGNVKWLIECAAHHAREHSRHDLACWLFGWLLAGDQPANVWIGATICNQAEADRDVPKLLATPAANRFLSVEPMLGPIDLRVAFFGHCPTHDFPGGFCLQRNHAGVQHLDWIICGGESGPHARPMHPDWAMSLRDQCAAAGVPFLFKQWGEFLPAGANSADPAVADVPESRLFWSDGAKWDRFDGQRGGVDLVARVGKHAAGRLLDGVEHNGVPALLSEANRQRREAVNLLPADLA